MKNKIKYLLFIPFLFLFLAGCSSKNITTTKNEYSADGLVAVVKGNAKGYSKVSYTQNGKTKSTNVTSNKFVFSVPVSSNDQTVKITAKDGSNTSSTSVTVKKAKPMTDYTTYAQSYNYMLLQSGSENSQLPLIFSDGIHKVNYNDGLTYRFNVQNGSLMGISIKVPMKTLKSKDGAKNFAQELAISSQLVGSDGQKVLKKLSKEFKDVQDGNTTTIDAVKSKGIIYNVNYSTSGIYIYMTK
ncbi:hypothetical protein [Lactobacillus terrae]|uniref:hypothetical protein n=1 Tax=Lactobacillus terrae TaxID=2269374 RepID=UPI000C1B6F4E|nr:hypothetical protein [Lactobacillus terrae]